MLTQDDQETSAPRAVKVSMSTAVWMVLTDRTMSTSKFRIKLGHLDAHVEASGDTSALQRLLSAVL